MRRALVLTLVLAMDAAAQTAIAQTVYPDARRLSDVACRLDGGAGCSPSTGGGTGVGFQCDLEDESCSYTAECADCGVGIYADSFGLLSRDGLTEIFGCSLAAGCAPLQPWRFPTGIPLRADVNQLTSSGTATGTANECVSGSGNVTVTLPADNISNSREMWIFDRAGEANACTIGVVTGQKLDGVTNGTVVMSDGEVRRLLQINPAGDWRTMSVYPNLHGVTTGAIPYASSSTAFAASEQTRVAQDSYRQVRGTNAQTAEWCMTYTDASNYACLRYSTQGTIQQLMTRTAGTGATSNAGGIEFGTTTGDIRVVVAPSVRYRFTTTVFQPENTDTYDLGNSAGSLWKGLYVSRGQQGSKSRALTESTATSFLRVAIPTGSSRGGKVTYTVRADDGTDFQTIEGVIVWGGANKAGTITLSTPVNTQDTCGCTTGTLTATATIVDAGSGNLEIKMNAVSSLTQTTLAIDYTPVVPVIATLTNL